MVLDKFQLLQLVPPSSSFLLGSQFGFGIRLLVLFDVAGPMEPVIRAALSPVERGPQVRPRLEDATLGVALPLVLLPHDESFPAPILLPWHVSLLRAETMEDLMTVSAPFDRPR